MKGANAQERADKATRRPLRKRTVHVEVASPGSHVAGYVKFQIAGCARSEFFRGLNDSVKQAFPQTSQRRRPRIMDMLSAIEKGSFEC